MKIGIINAGNLGARLARAWAAAGHDVMLSKDGDTTKLQPLIDELGGRVTVGSLREAALYGDVALFSVYWPRLDVVLEEIGNALDGKTVIETMNPLGVTRDFVHYHDTDFMRDSSTAEQLQARLPKSQVVKSFSTLAAPSLEAAAWSGYDDAMSVFYAGGDTAAKAEARKLITDAGFRRHTMG